MFHRCSFSTALLGMLFFVIVILDFSQMNQADAQMFRMRSALRNRFCYPAFNVGGRTEFELGAKVPLFNGTDLSGWTNAEGNESDNWKAEENMIVRQKEGGDLYTANQYENFILEFEFKISEKGNSGVKYRSWNPSGFGLGYEYQIFDDINIPDNPPKYRTASLYDVYVPETDVSLLKMDDFNQAKIVVMGNYIEHWLNGQRTCWAFIGSDDWNEKVAQSKFAETKEYGTTPVGRILLQDHGNQVWFRNISITELKAVQTY
ncbi:MAG: DUF1080 domain-containing protein [Planctomycetia bacterium]|nr:DUF1080 domain-containing protein [Planctomycetia bacterium]